ncbi:FadR/GntR family transcriptional regulator [Methylobacterium isbiliense]|uniref:HTH-type transcriptional repressor NanR n=1 Tax=Methylobacterium isbiliense TaxID=315478 RepID=A0ABQ4SIL4_9HYPH|nr:FCD domain-containing protein [Methylobacterium isbiliense]MDN3622389.1 FCD domain-containing protein [Methylobacterium isbiliense]GJE01580.1 HTH-type transcriptional repressor NanR [Methylobacterium isbiliense]
MLAAAEDRFERVEVASACHLVAEAIEREILSGRLRPGDGVGTEAALCRQFGVNRSTVREAIRMLEQGGLVQRGGDRRLYASLPRYSGLSSRVSRALILHEVTFRELWATARVLEIAAAEQAAENADAAAIDALEENQARAEQALDDPARLAELDSQFHSLMSKASRNRVLDLAREPAGLLFFPTTEMICRRVPKGAARMVAAHRHLIEALKARDAAAAALWMARHVADWRKGFERAGRDLDEPVERVFARHALRAPY